MTRARYLATTAFAASVTVVAMVAAGFGLSLGLSASGASAPRAQQTRPPDRYDLILAGGKIVDGSGNPWFRADIGITGDRIRAIGDLSRSEAARRIDASGLVVSPGFIDVHSHSINGLERLPTSDNVLFEGVTTAIDGNDGSSPLPIAAAFDRLVAQPISINLGFFAGHGSVRRQVMALADRTPTADEQARMNEIVAQAMRDGAMGLST
jgi:N-acyl-D-amino-acid deacylase